MFESFQPEEIQACGQPIRLAKRERSAKGNVQFGDDGRRVPPRDAYAR